MYKDASTHHDLLIR